MKNKEETMNNIFENLSEKTQDFYAPLNKLNELVLNNITQLIDIQSKSLSAYADMGIEQAKSSLEIKDMDALSEFLKQQSTVAEDAQKQFKGDIEKLSELASSFKTGLTDIFSTSDETSEADVKSENSSKTESDKPTKAK